MRWGNEKRKTENEKLKMRIREFRSEISDWRIAKGISEREGTSVGSGAGRWECPFDRRGGEPA
jgi:hypothetical protein